MTAPAITISSSATGLFGWTACICAMCITPMIPASAPIQTQTNRQIFSGRQAFGIAQGHHATVDHGSVDDEPHRHHRRRHGHKGSRRAHQSRLRCKSPASSRGCLLLCLESSNAFPTNRRRIEENLTQGGQRAALSSIQKDWSSIGNSERAAMQAGEKFGACSFSRNRYSHSYRLTHGWIRQSGQPHIRAGPILTPHSCPHPLLNKELQIANYARLCAHYEP